MFDQGRIATGAGVAPEAQSAGTRFLIYPQAPHVAGYGTPETVWISTPPDQLRAGPSDRRVYVRDPIFDKEPYGYPYLPPFVGDSHAPAEAGYDGHFDHIDPRSRSFLSAHAFACASRVLDIWESYVGRGMAWHFADTYERLEIIPLIDWDNAQSGYGYLELGLDRGVGGSGSYPFALNFDVIAHEIGHAILFSQVGLPSDGRPGGDYASVHEAGADLISLLSFLHFDSGMDRLLRHCGGNLLVLNELNRIAELSGDSQVRIASNARRLSEVTGDVHDRSRPLTGAVFDTLVDQYHAKLVAQGLADRRLLDVDVRDIDGPMLERLSQLTGAAFRARPFLFKSALIEARDEIALALARSWRGLDPDDLGFAQCADAVVGASAAVDPDLPRRFEINLAWRELM